MQNQAKLPILFLVLAAGFMMATCIDAAGAAPEVNRLVREFPTLDELETRLGLDLPLAASSATPSLNAPADIRTASGSIYPVSARWFTAPPSPDPFAPEPAAKSDSGPKPLAYLLNDIDAAQKEAGEINKQISAQNDLPVNKYLLDRVSFNATTNYGTYITGLFVNGIAFGSTQQTFRQSYAASYSLPLLHRFKDSTKWTRIFGGYTLSSSVGVMPLINPTLQLQQLLNNLQLTWTVSLSYDLNTSTLRKLRDGQYDQEAARDQAAGRASAAREKLLKTMAMRIDALSTHRPVSDTRLTSLREIYPQFELYQTRFEQATSCGEQMEDFFTLKGLALSLLTLAGYDHSAGAPDNLLQSWKHARFTACGSS